MYYIFFYVWLKCTILYYKYTDYLIVLFNDLIQFCILCGMCNSNCASLYVIHCRQWRVIANMSLHNSVCFVASEDITFDLYYNSRYPGIHFQAFVVQLLLLLFAATAVC